MRCFFGQKYHADDDDNHDHDYDDEDASLRLARELDVQLNGNYELQVPENDVDEDLACALKLDAEINGSQQDSGSDSNKTSIQEFLDFSSPQSHPQISIRGGGTEHPREQRQNTTGRARAFMTHSELAEYILSRSCAQCRTPVIRNSDQVTGIFSTWEKGQIPISSLLTCQNCHALVCMGCGTAGKKSPTTKIVKGHKVSWCCSRGRLFLIWAVLCGLDHACSLAREKQRNIIQTGTGSVVRRRGDGVGYGGAGGYGDLGVEHMLGGLGPLGGTSGIAAYHGRPESARISATRRTKAEVAQSSLDQTDQFVFTILAELLPDLDQNTHFDVNPPEAVLSMLLTSNILEKAAELLRNDSLEDVGKRKDLYQAVLDFLRIVGPHHKTGSAMFSDRVRSYTESLLSLSFANTRNTLVSPKRETSSSLADCLRNLNVQSNIMLRGAKSNPADFQTEESQNLLWLCRQISDLANYLLRTTVAGTGTAATLGKEDEDQGVVEVDDNLILRTYYYAAQLMRQSQQGRMKRLITELTTLKTGLPPGVFIKYAASRLDVMKFVIVGPRETPYENGLFEFDLFCGHEYPNQPPNVIFKGTGGGRVHFNPNLHPDGKVCLSLLGTWPGEPWRPGQSTILQILISVQAMIFCEDPIRNEPGDEAIQRDSTESHAYNQRIRQLTVQYAILPWLTHQNTLWHDDVLKHFKKNGVKIMRTLSQWESDIYVPVSNSRSMHMVNMSMSYRASTPSISSLKEQVLAGLQKVGVQVEMPRALIPSQQHSHGACHTPSRNQTGRHGEYRGFS